MRARPTYVKRQLLVVAVVAIGSMFVTACHADSNDAVEASPSVSESAPEVPVSSTVSTSKTSTPVEQPMRCDPGFGFPAPKDGCPDPKPETGWLTASVDGLILAPFRTLGNDAEGKAYARDHGVDYPFSGDYFDAPAGAPHPLTLTPRTVCTGIIVVDFQSPLNDHLVTCDELTKAAERRRVTVAVWLADGEVVQVSELYRP